MRRAKFGIQFLGLALLLILSVPGATSACSPNSELESKFVGRWNWVESRVFIGGGPRTPETDGYFVLTFRADGTYRTDSEYATYTGTWCVQLCPPNPGPYAEQYCFGQDILTLNQDGQYSWSINYDFAFCPDGPCGHTLTIQLVKGLQISAQVMDASLDSYEYLGPVSNFPLTWGTLKSTFD